MDTEETTSSKSKSFFIIAFVAVGVIVGVIGYLQWRNRPLIEKEVQKTETQQKEPTDEDATMNMPNLIDLQKETGLEDQKNIQNMPNLKLMNPKTEAQSKIIESMPNLNK